MGRSFRPLRKYLFRLISGWQLDLEQASLTKFSPWEMMIREWLTFPCGIFCTYLLVTEFGGDWHG